MSRVHLQFPCDGEMLAGTLDEGSNTTGLIIVSGGNEIRAGAHSGMAKLAAYIAAESFPVFRYDRRGVGDSSGENRGYLRSEDDIIAAANHFRSICPTIEQVVAFGNCDAATALILFGNEAGCDNLLLANPWILGDIKSGIDEPSIPSPSVVRARYWDRIKNPRTVIDLLKGQIDLRKLFKGLKQASNKEKESSHASWVFQIMADNPSSISILLANRDTTALAFQSAWKSNDFKPVTGKSNIEVQSIDSASHSFADEESKRWLRDQILSTLKNA